MNGFELIFTVFVISLLLFFIINALVTESVWVRGRRKGERGEAWFAHKRSKASEPISYWLILGFYSLGFAWMAWLIIGIWW